MSSRLSFDASRSVFRWTVSRSSCSALTLSSFTKFMPLPFLAALVVGPRVVQLLDGAPGDVEGDVVGDLLLLHAERHSVPCHPRRLESTRPVQNFVFDPLRDGPD